jgi:hypothetical protein
MRRAVALLMRRLCILLLLQHRLPLALLKSCCQHCAIYPSAASWHSHRSVCTKDQSSVVPVICREASTSSYSSCATAGAPAVSALSFCTLTALTLLLSSSLLLLLLLLLASKSGCCSSAIKLAVSSGVSTTFCCCCCCCCLSSHDGRTRGGLRCSVRHTHIQLSLQ